MSTRLTASIRVPLTVYNALRTAYGLKDQSELPREAIKWLEELSPAAFRFEWIANWPRKAGASITITKNIPKIVWNNLQNKWSASNPSALLRTGLYIAYAKRFDGTGWEQAVQQALTPEQPVVPIGLETAD